MAGRIRRNFFGGRLLTEALEEDLTLISTAFSALPVITGEQYLPIVLDPDGRFGTPEIVYVVHHTAGSDTITVQGDGSATPTRKAFEDSVGRDHPAGIEWVHAPTKFDGPVEQEATLFRAPDSPVHSMDDEFRDWSLDAAWVEVNGAGTPTWIETHGILSANIGGSGASTCSGLMKPLTGGAISPPVTIETAIETYNIDGNYNMAGLVFSDGTLTSDTIVWFMPYMNTEQGVIRPSLRTGTFASIPGGVLSETVIPRTGELTYQRLIWKSANTWRLEMSADGVLWTDFDFGSDSATMTPTHAGIGVSSWGGTAERNMGFHYFRVYEEDLSSS